MLLGDVGCSSECSEAVASTRLLSGCGKGDCFRGEGIEASVTLFRLKILVGKATGKEDLGLSFVPKFSASEEGGEEGAAEFSLFPLVTGFRLFVRMLTGRVMDESDAGRPTSDVESEPGPVESFVLPPVDDRAGFGRRSWSMAEGGWRRFGMDAGVVLVRISNNNKINKWTYGSGRRRSNLQPTTMKGTWGQNCRISSRHWIIGIVELV